MRRVQFFAGLAMVLTFLGGDAYMHFHLGHLRGFPPALRMVYRASHINLLLIEAVNIFASRRIGRSIERIASALVMAASLLFAIAFVTEPGFADLTGRGRDSPCRQHLERSFSKWPRCHTSDVSIHRRSRELSA